MTRSASPIASITTVEVHWLRIVAAAVLLAGVIAVAADPAIGWLRDGPWVWVVPLPLLWGTYRAGVYRLTLDVYADGLAVRRQVWARWWQERWIPWADVSRQQR